MPCGVLSESSWQAHSQGQVKPLVTDIGIKIYWRVVYSSFDISQTYSSLVLAILAINQSITVFSVDSFERKLALFATAVMLHTFPCQNKQKNSISKVIKICF